MSEVLVALVSKFPAGYLMGFVPFLCVLGVWVFSHIRVDKQGRRYWYSQKYEDVKRNKKQDAILEEATLSRQTFEDVRKDVLQLQICAANLPKTARRQSYVKYKELDYNGWMDDYVVENGLFNKEEVAYISANRGQA